MNIRDSEIMEQLLATIGYLPAPGIHEADLILLNTCSIRAKAEQKVFSLLGQLHDAKKHRPALLIGVAGCVAQQKGEEITQRMPHVDFVVGTQEFYRIPEIILRLLELPRKKAIATNLDPGFRIPSVCNRPFSGTSFRAPRSVKKFITIMQGCNNYCTYCVVPFTRGREISRPLEDILDEVRYYLSQGVKEITLLGQNVNSYGRTNAVADQPVCFSTLLRQVAEMAGLRRLRFTTSNPKDLSEDLMRCFAEIDTLCPQFHLPAQSGSDAVLKRMNRKYTRQQYLDKVALLRRYCPGITLSTDIIVGFPGETDEDFAQTMSLLETVRFHGSFSFRYSDRPGTRSMEFSDKVPEHIKAQRLAAFQQKQDEISFEHHLKLVDQHIEVLIESVNKESMFGRIPGGQIVHLALKTGVQAGEVCLAHITGASTHSLTGSMVQ